MNEKTFRPRTPYWPDPDEIYQRPENWNRPRRAGRNAPLTSRSADPGQSSYGGFSNEDTRFQRQYDATETGYRATDPYSWDMPESDRRQARSEYQRTAWQSDRDIESPPPRKLPKGYTRSDARISEEICERLSHSRLDVEDVSVSVNEGTALLEGNAKDRWTKHAIENLAADGLGVKDVDNHIRVVPGNKD
jgi:hypothetical protein